jgi:hypothetical protein
MWDASSSLTPVPRTFLNGAYSSTNTASSRSRIIDTWQVRWAFSGTAESCGAQMLYPVVAGAGFPQVKIRR